MSELRVTTWDDYVGQAAMKNRLQTHIRSAVDRSATLDHVLLAGPPGSGKTTMAGLIAAELGVDFMVKMAPIKLPVLKTILREFEGVVLIDEIHRMTKGEQESILTVLEDGVLYTDYGEIPNSFITWVGATTEPEKIIQPLKDRFPIIPEFVPYTDEEMTRIVLSMAKRIGIPMSNKNAELLGRATNGIPRAAEKFVVAARDLRSQDAMQILRFLNYTDDGLSSDHVRYLDLLCRNEVMGLDTISTYLALSKQSVLLLENLLVKKGLITYSKTGRVATVAARKQYKEQNAKKR